MVPLPCLGKHGCRLCFGSLSDLQGQFHEKGCGGRAGDGFRPVEFGGAGVWVERALHVGRAGLGGVRPGLVGEFMADIVTGKQIGRAHV